MADLEAKRHTSHPLLHSVHTAKPTVRVSDLRLGVVDEIGEHSWRTQVGAAHLVPKCSSWLCGPSFIRCTMDVYTNHDVSGDVSARQGQRQA